VQIDAPFEMAEGTLTVHPVVGDQVSGGLVESQASNLRRDRHATSHITLSEL
jgi:hypothetical protein